MSKKYKILLCSIALQEKPIKHLRKEKQSLF